MVLTRQGGRLGVRVGGASGIVRPRLLLVGVVLAVVAFGVFCLTIGFGSGDYTMGPLRVARTLFGAGQPGDAYVVEELRLPRAVAAALAGAGFGLSGALFQGVTRNPLASPDMIGITQGAGAAVALGVVLGIGAGLGTHGLGLVGALAAGSAIYVLAWNRGTTGYRIILVGIGVSWMCVSITTYLVSRSRSYEAGKVLGWLVGSLDMRGWDDSRPLGVALAVLVPTVLLLARLGRTLGLGDDVAAGLGTPVQRVRMALLLCAVVSAAFATAAAGPILFVALAAPQITQRLARVPAPPPLCSALTGATLVLVADLIAVRAMDDGVVPIGVVTGVLGAPFLLWQLSRANERGSGG